MNPDIVATIPLGLIMAVAIVLLTVGVTVGWYISGVRWQRCLFRAGQVKTRQIADLFNALPYAALMVNAQGELVVLNNKAAQLLPDLKRTNALPLSIDAAVGRVIHSRVMETLEPVLSGTKQQVQVLVAPVGAGEVAATHALVLFLDALAGSGQTQVYRQLVTAMGHELRTPLTAIVGHVDIIGSCQLEEEALWRRSLTFVAAEVERLTRLVEDLLSLSRLDRLPLYTRPMNLRLTAEEAVTSLFDAARQQEATLVLQAPNELPHVQADPDRIRQVFLNLLDNALKYAPGSTITVQLEPSDQAVQVTVQDTGPGISSMELDHIFEPFHRSARAPAHSSGSGLGLTIVHTILQQHNVPIQVDSHLGQGTTFTFSLPLAREKTFTKL